MLCGDVAACHRAECVLCAVQNETGYKYIKTLGKICRYIQHNTQVTQRHAATPPHNI
jgi:hypothetical protein